MSKHIKRLASPTTWKQARKGSIWSVKSSPGPHPVKESVPLMVIVRDVLHLADTSKEARNVITRGLVEIDGKIVKDYKRAVGFMDTLSIKETGLFKRVLLDKAGTLVLSDVNPNDAGWKLVKVTGKFIGKGGRIELSTHDGRVIPTDQKQIKRGDTLKITVPGQKIIEIYPLAKDTVVYVIGGSHRGSVTQIKEVNVSRSYQENTVESKDNFTTTVSNIFVLGKSSGEMRLAGGA
jgi:small subunit ribosomal protein S4e